MRPTKLEALARGLGTYVPGVAAFHRRITSTGGSDSARYCYSVWMRHLVSSAESGLCDRPPRTVAELGPGDSIGIGLAALLCGSEQYYGLDVLPLAHSARNLAIFEDLVRLFRDRDPIPDDSEFPSAYPKLRTYGFPADLVLSMEERRIARIRRSVQQMSSGESMVQYVAPWWQPEVIRNGEIGMIFSQAVLEHVDDLAGAYAAMRVWLDPDGWISHQVDFRCHATAKEWNGHWTYSDWIWRAMRGRRAYFINREPHSRHLQLLREKGFEVVRDDVLSGARIDRSRLAPRFASLTDADLTTYGAFIQARVAKG